MRTNGLLAYCPGGGETASMCLMGVADTDHGLKLKD